MKDMCTNDLYLCKDSSRINCTLACSTLGYIPCRNYVDKKICLSVNKKSSRFFSLKSAKTSIFDRAFFFDDPFAGAGDSADAGFQERFLFSFLSLAVLGGLFVLLILFTVLYRRNKRNKSKSTCRSSTGLIPGSEDDCGRTGRPPCGSISASTSLSSQILIDDIAKTYSSLSRPGRNRDDFERVDTPPLKLLKTDTFITVSFNRIICLFIS